MGRDPFWRGKKRRIHESLDEILFGCQLRESDRRRIAFSSFYLRNDISALLRFDRETQLRIFGSVALRPLRHPLFPSSENAPSLVSIEIFQDRRLSLPLPRELIDETDRNLEDLADREIRKRMLGSIERK